MRVLINSNPLSWPMCGTRTYTHNIVNALHVHHSDINLHLVTNHVKELPLPSLSISKIFPEIKSLKQKVFWEMLSFPLASLSAKCDVVHTPYHSTTIWTKAPSLMTIFDAHIWESDSPRLLAERLDKSLLQQAAKNANRVITISTYSKERLVDLIGINPEKIVVTPLSAGSAFKYVPSRSNEPLAFGSSFTQKRSYILYAGGSAKRKGVIQLLRAYFELDSALRESHDLVIVGDFTSMADHHVIIREFASKPSRFGKIYFPGILSDEQLALAYQKATVFVFPSFKEGFGLTPLEAMSCGAPVIVSNRTSLPEVVGGAGLYIDPDDIDSITLALSKVLESSSLRESLKKKGFERATHFDWRITSDLTVDAYRSILS